MIEFEREEYRFCNDFCNVDYLFVEGETDQFFEVLELSLEMKNSI